MSGQRSELGLIIRFLECRYDLIDFAFHHLRQAVKREADAVLGDAILEKMIRADAFATVARTDLVASYGRVFGVFFVLAALKQA